MAQQTSSSTLPTSKYIAAVWLVSGSVLLAFGVEVGLRGGSENMSGVESSYGFFIWLSIRAQDALSPR
jgi:hypothetical protein